MSLLSKKLYVKNNGGTVQAVNLYTDPANEISTGRYGHVIVDGVTAHFALGGTSDSRATSGRVKETSGTTYAILTTGVANGSSQWTTGNAYQYTDISFTVPASIKVIQITCSRPKYNIVFNDANKSRWMAAQAPNPRYIGVTPGKTYGSLQLVSTSYNNVTFVFSWSEAINNHSIDVSDY